VNITATIIGQVVWFLLFIWFVMKLVWPYLQRVIAERQKIVADGLAAAEQGKLTLELSSKKAGEQMKEATVRAAERISSAEQRAAQIIEDAKAAAKEESSREKAAAKAEIEQQYARAREALREQVAALAVAGAEKILRREVNAQAHAEMLGQLKGEL